MNSKVISVQGSKAKTAAGQAVTVLPKQPGDSTCGGGVEEREQGFDQVSPGAGRVLPRCTDSLIKWKNKAEHLAQGLLQRAEGCMGFEDSLMQDLP